MKLTSTPVLAVDLDASAFGPSGGTAADWLAVASALEAAGVGLVSLADQLGAADGVARVDAVMRAGWLAASTSTLGLATAVETTVTEPFLLAAQIATLDFVSAGRAGWLVQVAAGSEGAGYVGPRAVVSGSEAWAEATEFVEVVRALWDSWEDGAEIRDVPGQRFIDRELIHHIGFTGEYLSVVGPSITPRSPQAQPPVAMALGNGTDADAVALGVGAADLLFLGPEARVTAVRDAAVQRGRPVRLLADLAVAEASVGRVGEALSDSFHGVRLIPSSLPDDLGAIVDLAGALGLTSARAGRSAGTLRDALGLTRPANRFAGVSS